MVLLAENKNTIYENSWK